MSDPQVHQARLDDIDARQDEVLRELDRLNEELELLLKQVSPQKTVKPAA